MIGLVDTNIVIDLLRKHPSALQWFAKQGKLGYSDFVWFEAIEGAVSKVELEKVYTVLKHMTRVQLHPDDMEWARKRLPNFALSHHVDAFDCLIAASAFRLQLPLYTQNLKHFTPLLGALAVQPYTYPI